MRKTVLINVVGLTQKLMTDSAPQLKAFAQAGCQRLIQPMLPALTCPVQSTYLTGKWPSEHGIVGNGWYFRDEAQIQFWLQTNALVQAPKIWDLARARDPSFTCANVFWWYNMYSSVDYAVTPRPMYPADGRKIPDIYTKPDTLRTSLQKELGPFPLFNFWGPMASIESSEWITAAALRVDQQFDPTLSLIYLPHLDYDLQRWGPGNGKILQAVAEIDRLCGKLIDYFSSRAANIIILSEYGINRVSRPIHINRLLRENGFLKVREELGLEQLDAGASAAFAVSDHQVAHVYVSDARLEHEIQRLLEQTPGIAVVLNRTSKGDFHLNHARSGELIAVAAPDAWFTYYYWLDDQKAPDFARTVDIHRKPGYDPAELVLDPKIHLPQLKIAQVLLRKSLGFRALMEVVPIDGNAIKGSHGHLSRERGEWPVFLSNFLQGQTAEDLQAVDVCSAVLEHLGSSM